MGERAKEAITIVFGLSFIPLYLTVGPLAMFIMLLIFIWGLVILVVTIIIRGPSLSTDYEKLGCGCWRHYGVCQFSR
jgi:hypothetical protein